jgi:hypothetical protein
MLYKSNRSADDTDNRNYKRDSLIELFIRLVGFSFSAHILKHLKSSGNLASVFNRRGSEKCVSKDLVLLSESRSSGERFGGKHRKGN